MKLFCAPFLFSLTLVPVAALHAQESAPATVLPPGASVGPAPAVAPASGADLDWASLEKALKGDAGEKFPSEPLPRMVFAARRMPAILAACETFYLAHPEDARRWKAVGQMINLTTNWLPQMVRDPATDAAVEPVFPRLARDEWLRKSVAYAAASATAADVPARERAYLALVPLTQLFTTAALAKLGEPSDLTAIRVELDRMAARFPDENIIAFHARNYLDLKAARGARPSELKAEWTEFTQSPNEALRKSAAGQLKLIELQSHPMDLAFTAVDGRAVDLNKLRGKVVLIDFWATWCGPCIAELPNVKKVYAAYHDKGFEVISISLENAGLTPKDTPEQTAAKLEKAKKKLTDFTTKEEMPWPQQFDGKFWNNEIAKSFGISGIPAMFLLDPEGKVASTEARGTRLEAEVRRLLKL